MVNSDRCRKVIQEYVHLPLDVEITLYEAADGKGVATIVVHEGSSKPHIVSKDDRPIGKKTRLRYHESRHTTHTVQRHPSIVRQSYTPPSPRGRRRDRGAIPDNQTPRRHCLLSRMELASTRWADTGQCSAQSRSCVAVPACVYRVIENLAEVARPASSVKLSNLSMARRSSSNFSGAQVQDRARLEVTEAGGSLSYNLVNLSPYNIVAFEVDTQFNSGGFESLGRFVNAQVKSSKDLSLPGVRDCRRTAKRASL
jgi:hypothetical protein